MFFSCCEFCIRDLKILSSTVPTTCEQSHNTDHLVEKNKKSKENHRSPTPVRELSEHLTLKLLKASESPVPSSLKAIDELVSGLSVYTHTSIDHLLPLESLKKHRRVTLLIESGLSCPVMLLIYSPGGSIANLQFMWPVPQDVTDEAMYFESSQATIERIKPQLPIFHTRTMKRAVFEKFGRTCISNNVKPNALRYFYKEITGILIKSMSLYMIMYHIHVGESSAPTTDQSIIDKRIKEIIELEDLDVIADLRAHNGATSTCFEAFWDECNHFLNEEIGVAVDDRRHGQVTHLARAISIKDFITLLKSGPDVLRAVQYHLKNG